MLTPEVKILIAALRDGKSSLDAFKEYCWAKLVIPVKSPSSYARRGADAPSNPRDLHPAGYPLMCMAMAADAFNDGADDEAIAAAFYQGVQWDRENNDVIYRTMDKDERPSFGDLVRAMSLDEQMKTAEIFGIKRVALAVARAI